MRPRTRFAKIAATLSVTTVTILAGALHALGTRACVSARLVPGRVRTPTANRISDRSALAAALFAIFASLLIAGVITILTATQHVTASSHESAAAERRPIGPQCSQRPWPYYEARCVRDLRPLEGQGRAPRVVTTDPS